MNAAPLSPVTGLMRDSLWVHRVVKGLSSEYLQSLQNFISFFLLLWEMGGRLRRPVGSISSTRPQRVCRLLPAPARP